MSVTEAFVQGPPDSTGKKIDTIEVITGQGTVEREVSVLGDPENPNARAGVDGEQGRQALAVDALALEKLDKIDAHLVEIIELLTTFVNG